MKCRYCHKNVRSIAHFMQAHKSLMMRKMRTGRGRGRRKASHRSSGGEKGHYCPVCGRKH